MWIVGLVGLGIAAFCGYVVVKARKRQHQMITTETMAVQDLHALRDASAEAAGPGFFRQKCEVVGVSGNGPDGPLTSELSSTECLWHRHVVTRKYWETERRRDSGGTYRTRRVEKTERVAERESDQPFTVTDSTGSILVHPADGALQDMRQVLDRFEPHTGSTERTELSFGSFSFKLPSSRRDGTIGYRYEEWVLPAGRELYVLGEVNDERGELAFTAPDLVSTKDEETLLGEARRRERFGLIGGGVAALVGIVLIVIDVLS